MRAITWLLLIVASCGGTTLPSQPSSSAGESGEGKARPAGAVSASTSTRVAKAPPGAEEVFTALRPDLSACYEEGRKALPAMTSGKVTFHASIDREGKIACVVPTDDTGLSQGVEDCMRERLSRETYPPAEPWSYELTIVVRDGVVTRGPQAAAGPAIETIDTHGVDAPMSMVQSLLSSLDDCMQDLSRSGKMRVIYVGGRVGRDGRVECALTTSAEPVPAAVRECASGVLMKTRFSPPKSGSGLISIPVKVMAQKGK